MAFPSSPTNGQTANVNGVVYTYDSTLTAWTVTSNFSGNVTVDQINANAVVSVTSVGAITFTGTTITASGNIAGGNVNTSTVNASTIIGTTITSTGNATIASSIAIGATTPSSTAGEIRATNAITAFYSDRRLKTEVSKIENALDKIDQLVGVIYTQNALAEQFGYNNYDQQVGLYAQDVKLVQPEAVKPAPFDMKPDGSSLTGENYLTVQYEKLIPLIVEGIKELRAEVNALKDK